MWKKKHIQRYEADFKKCWYSTKKNEEEKGTALLLEPGPEFFDREDEKENRNRNLQYFLRYLAPYKSQLVQLILGMLVVSILQLIFLFLTQSLVDVGIWDGNLGFIMLILIAQLVIFAPRTEIMGTKSGMFPASMVKVFSLNLIISFLKVNDLS